ncbi:uncharacterized mitochondrial protein AtMg01250-like [Cornus florida]|uniref:uncharacterized mitochondrial protein AtMg01250-like n=1 Tax=Cornus florida TaxID=4283 RepID=UPI002898031F|nr:uncharacterized mitochondrial protein AtMg01250-like [Cornus florida]
MGHGMLLFCLVFHSHKWFSMWVFQPSKGLRQGCPLSSLPFTLVTEYFSNQMANMVREGQITLLRGISKEGLHVLYMFFADDLMVVLKADVQTARNPVTAMSKFVMLSGLKVSPEKSNIFFTKSVKRGEEG